MKKNKTSDKQMTFASINKALGQEWFSGNKLTPGSVIAYARENDVEIITVENVIAASDDGDQRILIEYVGKAKDRKRFESIGFDTLYNELHDDDNIAIHGLDKWQARGAWAFTVGK